MNKKPRIGITAGDPASISGEITAKLFAQREIYNICNPLVIGDSRVMKDGIRIARKDLIVHPIKSPLEARFEPGKIDVIDLENIALEDFKYGQISAESGRASGQYIERAVELALSGDIDAIVTNAINKEAFLMGGFPYPGHTEMLATLTGARKYSMMLIHKNLRVLHVTTHIPLREVSQTLTINRIYDTIELAHSACRKLGIQHPRIGVAALNPHASDNGRFGDEESRIITPAINLAKTRGIAADGPVPADTLFCKAKGGMYDAVVAMYHDQGHIPIKYGGFEYNEERKQWATTGVNATLGLPGLRGLPEDELIRTSVDHGTAYGKAGKGTADYKSLEDALNVAVQMVNAKNGS